MPRTGDIVNQNENDRPNIQGATVSYQTMSNLSVPIWEFLNQSRSGCGRVPQAGEIFFDNTTEVGEPGCFRTKGKPANGNGFYQTTQNLKFSRSHFAVKDLVSVGISDQREECRLGTDRFYARRGAGAAVTQDIYRRKGEWAAFKPRVPLP